MSTEIRKSQQTGQRGWRNRIKQGCPSLGHRVPTLWASVAQGLSNVSPSLGPSLFCSFLYLVDYIVPYSYCKLTIIFSIPNSTCQSSILFLVSIYILPMSWLFLLDFKKTKMQYAANIQNFSKKFAVRCKFFSFLYIFCSTLHFYLILIG